MLPDCRAVFHQAWREDSPGSLNAALFTAQVNLEPFYEPIEAVEGTAGRTPWDLRLLISIWMYASSRGISSAREIARRGGYDPALQWLCGLAQSNYHTLSDVYDAQPDT